MPGQTLETFLTSLERAEKVVGARVRRTLMESVASALLQNSPYEQLKLRFRTLNMFAKVSVDIEGINDDDEPEAAMDLSPFINKSGHLVVDRVAVFTSKAGPVFSSALDLMEELMRTGRDVGVPSIWMASVAIQRRLAALHVFDEGNSKALTWVQQRRSETLSFVDPFRIANHILPPPASLVAIDSKTSPYVQAADVAAGIARTLFETDAPRLRATFDYVMHNGRQIGGAVR